MAVEFMEGLIGAGIAVVSSAAACGATVRSLNRRVTALEHFRNEAPETYVRRDYLKLALDNIEKSTSHTARLVEAFVYHGGDRALAIHAIEAAAADPEHPEDSVVDTYVAGICQRFEGVVPHFYLDTRGLVTIGTGNMVPDVAAALKLPLRTPGGEPATAAQISSEFLRVRAMTHGHMPQFYQTATSPLLGSADNAALLRSRCVAFESQLTGNFAGYWLYPVDARIALLDMVYNLGLGRAPRSGVEGSGLLGFTHLGAAVRNHDWAGAADCCARDVHDPAFCARNAWTRSQFISAAKEVNGGALASVHASGGQFVSDAIDYVNTHSGTVVFVLHQVVSAGTATMPETPPRTLSELWAWMRDFSHQFINTKAPHLTASAAPEEPVSHPKP
jgi:GH24 family phage-related lysozyme (muramidase)